MWFYFILTPIITLSITSLLNRAVKIETIGSLGTIMETISKRDVRNDHVTLYLTTPPH